MVISKKHLAKSRVPWIRWMRSPLHRSKSAQHRQQKSPKTMRPKKKCTTRCVRAWTGSSTALSLSSKKQMSSRWLATMSSMLRSRRLRRKRAFLASLLIFSDRTWRQPAGLDLHSDQDVCLLNSIFDLLKQT